MSDYSGEDLLNVFGDLNVRLLNFSPNVIKAWFDTDDKDMKNLLTWMCTSLSKRNYVSPLESSEFLELEAPLVDERYERELKNIETEYPGLFDVDSNNLEIEFIQDEIDLILEEERHIDDLIRMNEVLRSELSRELAQQTSKEIEVSLKLKSAQEHCNSLGEQLDNINGKLHMQLVKYGSNLYDFEFSSIPNFINNMDIKACQENFESIASFLLPILETEFLPVNVTGVDNRTYLDSISSNDSNLNNLITMKDRILHSHQNYLVCKIEVEKLKEILSYLNKTGIDTIVALSESVFSYMSRESKEETKKRMCEMLDNISEKLADKHISQTKFKYVQQELELHQTKLNNLKKIEEVILKYCCQYILLCMLYIQEKKDIDNSDSFFRKILNYISKDLQSCTLRTQKMKQIICEYENYTSKDVGERCKIIKSIIKILSDENDFSLSKALEVVGEFKNELNMLENKLFCLDFNDYKSNGDSLRSNIKILQSFLVCGPTHRVVLVPSELNCVLREVDENLKKQVAVVKSALEISSNMRKMIENKWQNYRRQLWMYFYTDPQKLHFVIQQIEEEFKKKKLDDNEGW